MTVFTSLVSVTVCLQQMLRLAELRLECNIQTLCYVCMPTLLVFVVLLKATCVRQKYKENAFFRFHCFTCYSDALQWYIVSVFVQTSCRADEAFYRTAVIAIFYDVMPP